jgi:cytochrome c oxidase assembly protein subunit 15
MRKEYSTSVKKWLFIGLVMIFIQVVVGGITRLTESGLSITKWEVISGTIPPLNDESWQKEFDLYKGTPQYKEINEGMSLSDFKFIYFWEWVHRFWARFMGFVFIIPFLIFTYLGWLDKQINRRLLLVVALAALAAIFGWIMVASGLIERPWVNAYKLSIHLSIAFSVFAALFWTYLWAINRMPMINVDKGIKVKVRILLAIYVVQMVLGGILSGMKAAVVYPSWPDMNGKYFPAVIFDSSQWHIDNLIAYDSNPFMPALIHFLHRNTAYILFFFGLWTMYRLYKMYGDNVWVKGACIAVSAILFCQFLLGVITVISSQGSIPVLWGTLHQAFALMLLGSIVYTFFVLRTK